MSIYQLVIKYRRPAVTEYRNVHHYEFPGYVPTEVELQEFVDNWDSEFKTELLNNISTLIQIYEYDVRRVDVGDLPAQQMVPTAGAWFGTGAAALIPYQVAALVSWSAPTAYPRTTRSYIGGLTTTEQNSTGVLANGLVTDLNNWGLEAEEIAVTGQVDAQKVAVEYGGDPRVVTASNVVSFKATNPIFRTQRRRVPGVGI